MLDRITKKMLLAICSLLLLGSTTIAELTLKDLDARLERINQKIDTAMRQMMLQQTFVEEKIRSDGDSGIKQVRLNRDGTRPYHTPTHIGYQPAQMYGITHFDRMLGISAPQVVMNGIEFRMRSEWIYLRMPSRRSNGLHQTEQIPLPPVPPEVLKKKTVEEQIKEMQEWFKAWKNSDRRRRDYRKYFKPVMCYLEGAWLNGNKQRDGTPFDSYFSKLQDIKRWEFSTGSMPDYDKYPWLPTRIQQIVNDTAVYAQWSYRVLCNPISIDLPPNRLSYVDDLATRMARGWTLNQYIDSDSARFRVDPRNRGPITNEFFSNYGLIDTIMAEIPGKDNYGRNLTDDSFDLPAYGYKGGAPILNTAYYHRWYKVRRRGAMGLSTRKRGYADNYLFMAQTSQPKVASMSLDECKRVGRKKVCKERTQKWSYAIPLAITYLTPLSSWNPYGIKVSSFSDVNTFNKIVKENGKRNGGLTPDKAYKHASQRAFFLTPKEFFAKGGARGVLDPKGNVRQVRNSGQYMVIRDIGGGVGNVRQMFPIFPVHGEGNTAWKELAALEDIVMDQKKYLNLYREKS